jgi:diaminopimelate epimerase
MAKSVRFEKYTGAGNDFIVVDNRKNALRGGMGPWAVKQCDRKNGVGADGVLLLEVSKRADARMRIFNPDGSQAEMCGNGVRCLAHFALAHRAAKAVMTIETGAGLIHVWVRGNTVKAKLTDPKDFRADVDVRVNGRTERVQFLNTGVPHAVVVESALGKADVQARGRAIRYHEAFAPKGTNVNFVRFGSGSRIEVRTYERGVEGETLACGTGSTASALVAARLKNLKSPVDVKTSGGENLRVYFKETNGRFEDVYLEGPVRKTFEGSIEP